MEKELTLNQMVRGLLRVGHKDLSAYTKDGLNILQQDCPLFAHMIAWNQKEGEIRDSKVALPIIGLRGEKEFHENAIAHLLLLDPRNLVRACSFNKELGATTNGAGKLFKQGLNMYLRIREERQGWWDRTALQHRKSLKTLYAINHIKPNLRAQAILFEDKYPDKSVFNVIRNLRTMAPEEAAGNILNHKIPFTIAIGALGGINKNVSVILSLIENMSGSDLITNSKMLVKMGVMDNPILKSAYESGLAKAKKDKKVSSLKAGRAMEFVEDNKIKAKLDSLQESKLEDLAKLEGDWLILGDKSGSMTHAIDKAKEVAAFLTKIIKGKVYLIFFDTMPRMYDATGETLSQIKANTAGIRANGGTSIGCGLQLLLDKNIMVNGIIIVSDGGENNTPEFPSAYRSYEDKMGLSPNTYLLHVPGDTDSLSAKCKHIPYETIEVADIDHYGLPNLAKILSSSRYTLIDNIMQTPLLTIKGVIGKEVVYAAH